VQRLAFDTELSQADVNVALRYHHDPRATPLRRGLKDSSEQGDSRRLAWPSIRVSLGKLPRLHCEFSLARFSARFALELFFAFLSSKHAWITKATGEIQNAIRKYLGKHEKGA